ncbi:MAG: hypothetical protein JWO89_3676 [Verrucomicrobiaceae bacterium]|nr:hypothetical protein [Verrucomicrobiaceae bacterium]
MAPNGDAQSLTRDIMTRLRERAQRERHPPRSGVYPDTDIDTSAVFRHREAHRQMCFMMREAGKDRRVGFPRFTAGCGRICDDGSNVLAAS